MSYRRLKRIVSCVIKGKQEVLGALQEKQENLNALGVKVNKEVR